MCLCVLCPSDSDGSVDSDIEDAIMAQLYFRDAVKKKSGMHYILRNCSVFHGENPGILHDCIYTHIIMYSFCKFIIKRHVHVYTCILCSKCIVHVMF